MLGCASVSVCFPFLGLKEMCFYIKKMLEKFGWHAYCFQVKLVNSCARACRQVRVLLIVALAMLFSLFSVVVNLFHACITLAK